MTIPLSKAEQKRVNFTEQFPTFFEDIYNTKEPFSQTAENVMQQLRIIYEENLVTQSIAVIFVSENKNKYLKKAETASKLFKDVLYFDEVSVYVGLTKSQIIEKFDLLQMKADQFEYEKEDRDILAMTVVSIGSVFDLETDVYWKE